VNIHASDGYGVKFWNGSDAYSVSMSSTSNTSFGNNGAGATTGTDYHLVLRMDGTGGRVTGDYTYRGIMFRNNSLPNPSYAQVLPFGNNTYWGGMLILRDTGNNKFYGIYFQNGNLMVKEMS
jgi:hypothetical protein